MPEEKNLLPKKTGLMWVVLAAAAVPLALIFGRDVIPPVRFFLWHAASLAWYSVLLFSAWWQGSRLLGILVRGEGEDLPLPAGIVSMGLGLGLFSLEAFLMGALSLFGTAPFTILVLALTGAGALGVRRNPGSMRREWSLPAGSGTGSALPLSLAGAAAAVSFPFALVPTRAFDALAYHLEVPLRYLQAGRVIDIPENLYSYAPQLVHSLYGLALGLGGSDLAGLLNHLFFLLTLAVLWLGFGEYFGREGGAWAAAFAALSPMMLIEAAGSGVDWAAAFYTLAALSLLAAGSGDRKRIVLAGILAGMAAGCRHHPLFFAVLLPPLAGLAADVFSRRRPRIGTWALFVSVAVLACSPWYFRNWFFTGDPLYPLLANLAGKTEAGSGWVSALVGAKSFSLVWKWVALPFRMVFNPVSQSMTATIGIQYLVLLPLLAVKGGKRQRSGFLFFWLVLAFLSWYLNFRAARYAMPVFLAGGLWLGGALSRASGAGTAPSRVLRWALATALAANAGIFVGIQDYVNRSVGAALGTRSSSSYLMETYEVYPAIDYLNRLDPPPRKVLFVGEMRGFYSGFPREVPSHNMPNRLLELIKGEIPPASVGAELARGGFSHILVNASEWQRMAYRNRSAPAWRLSGGQEARFEDFLSGSAEQVFSRGPVSVYRLATEAGP